MKEGPNVLDVPTVEDKQVLAEELKKSGFMMSLVAAHAVDVKMAGSAWAHAGAIRPEVWPGVGRRPQLGARAQAA